MEQFEKRVWNLEIHDPENPDSWVTRMLDRKPKYSPDEQARLGNQIYEREIRPKVEQNQQGRVVAIDVDSSEFEVADNSLAASQLLLARLPNAQIWCIRIGAPAVNRFGPRGSAVRA